MKAAIYARYSTDLQNDRSIEDQTRACREFVDAQGGSVISAFEDRGISGTTLKTRPGIQSLLHAVKAGVLDTVVVVDLDRLSRDQEGLAHIHKRLTHANVTIINIHGQKADKMHVGLGSLMSAMLLDTIRDKTRIGLQGVIEDDRIPSAPPFGYELATELDDKGERVRGKFNIVEEDADVVRRVFDEYISGRTPRQIAEQLNRDAIKGPKGGLWTSSNILTNRRRRVGILYNDLYIGLHVWNKQTYAKDPDTEKRTARLNPTSEWRTRAMPHLCILDADVWNAAQARLERRSLKQASKPQNRKKYLLSGLLKCTSCGGNYIVLNSTHVVCSNHKSKKSCTNNRTVQMGEIERRVIEGVRDHLLDSEVIESALKVAQKEIKRTRAAEIKARKRLEGELSDNDRQVKKLVHTLATSDDAPVKGILDQLRTLETREGEIRNLLAAEPDHTIELHPEAPAKFRQLVEQLDELFARERYRHKTGTPEANAALAKMMNGGITFDVEMDELKDAFRALISEVVIVPGDQPGDFELEISGDITSLMRQPGNSQPIDIAKRFAMVAGAGFEPTTFRL